jgi:TPR repeat protein
LVAQNNLGVMYQEGRGVTRDYVEAVKWYRTAAEQGHITAQYNLGEMYANGDGAAKDVTEAHGWLTLAATRASGDAQKKYASSRADLAKQMTPAQVGEAQKRAHEWSLRSLAAANRAFRENQGVTLPRVVREVKPKYTINVSPGAKTKNVNVVDPDGIRLELNEYDGDSLPKKAIDTWK